MVKEDARFLETFRHGRVAQLGHPPHVCGIQGCLQGGNHPEHSEFFLLASRSASDLKLYR